MYEHEFDGPAAPRRDGKTYRHEIQNDWRQPRTQQRQPRRASRRQGTRQGVIAAALKEV